MPAWCIAAVWLTAAERDPSLPMWQDAVAALGPEVHDALLGDPGATMCVLEEALQRAAPLRFAEALQALVQPRLQRLLEGAPSTETSEDAKGDAKERRQSDSSIARLTSTQLRASELAILQPLVQTQPQ